VSIGDAKLFLGDHLPAKSGIFLAGSDSTGINCGSVHALKAVDDLVLSADTGASTAAGFQNGSLGGQ